MRETLRVLVVDDMKTTREILLEALRQIGIHHLRDAANGHEALEVLSEGETDLVISDLHMPDMDGLELYRRMKKCDRLGKVQFVLATGDNALAKLPQNYRLGGHLMRRKPFDRDGLLNCLDEAATRRSDGTDASTDRRSKRAHSA